MKTFKKICRKDQYELKKWLEKLLNAKYKEVINGDGFLYAKGNVPILLTAHMDTVHKDKCRDIIVTKEKGKTKLWSPQGIGGDDRCGIWMIWMVLCKTKYRPSILFCEDEEIGGVGSGKFAKTKYMEDLKELKYLVELDRANAKDAVYYDCGNEEFMEYIETTIGYKEAYGSFSDIGHLSPGCDKASVNLGCGYYKQHTLEEYVIFEEMFNTFKAVKVLLSKANDCEVFDYQEANWGLKYDFGYRNYNHGYGYGGSWYGDEGTYYEINFYNKDGKEDVYCVNADSFEEAVGSWLIEHSALNFKDSFIDYFEY